MSIKPEGEWHKAKVFSLTHLMLTLGCAGGLLTFFYVFGQEFGVVKSEVERHSVEIRKIQSDQVTRDNAISAKLDQQRLETKSDIYELRKELGGKMDMLIKLSSER